ncbi:MAG: 30S ribosome-binding factor RbfA [Candidatus Omnitrophota bacterium]
MDKINQMFKREIGGMILLGEIRDPRIKFVTITFADVSKDLSWAHIGFSILSDKPEDIKSVQQGLDSASGMVRRLMGQRITLRHIPQVKFVYDDSIVRSVHLSNIFNDLQQERVARGVDPLPETPEGDDEKQDGE